MWDWGNFGALLANGTLASYASPDWWVPQVNLASTGSSAGAVSAMSGKKEKRAEVKYQFRVRALPLYKKRGSPAASWGGSFMAIPKGTKNPDLIYKIAEYLQYDMSALKVRWQDTSMLPPFAEVWNDPIFKKEDERFGGQKLGELMASQAMKMPDIISGDIFWDAIGDFSQQYTEIASGKISLDEGLKKAQQKSMERYTRLNK